jgi:predicted  nucleic acid-binding Zn-ribbon protein
MAQSAEERLDRVAELAAKVAEISNSHQLTFAASLEKQDVILSKHTEALVDIRVTLAKIDGRTESLVKDVGKIEKSQDSQQKQIDGHSGELNIIRGVGGTISVLLGTAIALFHGK